MNLYIEPSKINKSLSGQSPGLLLPIPLVFVLFWWLSAAFGGHFQISLSTTKRPFLSLKLPDFPKQLRWKLPISASSLENLLLFCFSWSFEKAKLHFLTSIFHFFLVPQNSKNFQNFYKNLPFLFQFLPISSKSLHFLKLQLPWKPFTFHFSSGETSNSQNPQNLLKNWKLFQLKRKRYQKNQNFLKFPNFFLKA